jgi:hypothetical protein
MMKMRHLLKNRGGLNMFGRELTPEMLSFLTNGEMDEDSMTDMVTCCDDINIHQEDELYFIIGQRNNAVELFGCPSRDGIMALAVYFNTFLLTSPSVLFIGTIQNPKELPYEMANRNQIVLVIFSDHIMKMFYNMIAATRYIERMLRAYSASHIDDFAIVIGTELEFDVREWNKVTLEGVVPHGLC